jgi:GT2 family glycosyltransferase
MMLDVSVVIPAHDARDYLLEAMDSVLAQSLAPREIVVVDDRSTDGTAEALHDHHAARLAGAMRPPVRLLTGAFGSAAAARNAGWRAARGNWIALLDADDVWFPDKLASAAAALARVPDAAWFFSDGTFQTLDGVLHPSWFSLYADVPESYAGRPLAALFDVNFILTSSMVIRRELLERLGGFDESMSHAEDVDLWIRLARHAPAVATARTLLRYQHRPGGLTRQTESRLLGSADLFTRLSADPSLPPALRARARRRAATARYKLAFAWLREGDVARARGELRAAMREPGRVPAALALWGMSLLPGAARDTLRRHSWAKRRIAAPTLALRRVRLESEPGLVAAEVS